MAPFSFDSHSAQPSMLIQLIAAQSEFLALASHAEVAELLARTLESIPGVESSAVCIRGIPRSIGSLHNRCRDCPDPCLLPDASNTELCPLLNQDHITAIRLESGTSSYGYIFLSVVSTELFEPYRGCITNIAASAVSAFEVQSNEHALKAASDKLRMLNHSLTTVAHSRTGDNVNLARIVNKSDFVAFRWKYEDGWSAIFVTDNVEKLTGYTAEDLLSSTKPYREIIHPDDVDRVARELEHWGRRKEGESLRYEPYRIVTKGGKPRWVSETRHIVWDASGVPVNFESIVHDVTASKNNDDRVRLDASRTAVLLELHGISEDLDEVEFLKRGLEYAEQLTNSQISFVHFVNDDETTLESIAWSRTTLNDYCDAVPDRHYPVKTAGIWANALRERAPVVFNDYASCKSKRGLPDGHAILKRLISVPVFNNGQVVMLVGVGNSPDDYTEVDVETVQLFANEIWRLAQLRRVEVKTRRSYHAMNRSANEIYIIDADTLRFVEANAGALKNVQYTIQELECMTPLDLAPEYTAEALSDLIEPLQSGTVQLLDFRTVHRRKDGSLYPVEVFLEFVRGNPDSFVAVILDITKRKKAELRLRKLEVLASSTSDMLAMLDVNYRYIAVNEAYANAFEKPSAEIVGNTVEEVFGVEYFNRVIRPRADQCLLGRTVRVEDWVVFPTTRRKYMDILYEPYRNEDGQVTGFVVSARDITGLREADVHRRRLAVAIEQMVESVLITDLNGTIEYVNPAFEAISGYSREELEGMNPRLLKSGHQDRKFYERFWDTLLKGEIWHGRFVNKKKDGTIYTEDAIVSPVVDEHGNTVNYVAVKRDITEQLLIEKQLRQSQHLESVGQLAGGIAHDFNNMLGVILIYNELAMKSVRPDQSLYSHLTEIQKAAEHSSALTSQLLSFARKQPTSPQELDMNDIVTGMLNILRKKAGKGIEIDWNPVESELKIKADPVQIEQILTNLCLNACDAIATTGKITIQADSVTVDPARSHPQASRLVLDYIKLTVSDSGSGMDEETLARIFEPFFTTKEVGEGSGLGLAVVHGIVTQNNGFIEVQSEIGSGSSFDVYLPRHTGESIQKNLNQG